MIKEDKLKRKNAVKNLSEEKYQSNESLLTIVFILFFIPFLQYFLIWNYHDNISSQQSIFFGIIVIFSILYTLFSCVLFIVIKRRLYEIATQDISAEEKGLLLNSKLMKFKSLFFINQLLPYGYIRKGESTNPLVEPPQFIRLITHTNEDFLVDINLFNTIKNNLSKKMTRSVESDIQPVLQYRYNRVILVFILINIVYYIFILSLLYI